MKVHKHPKAAKSSRLRILFTPGDGFSIRQSHVNGPSLPTIPEAVKAWNEIVTDCLAYLGKDINFANLSPISIWAADLMNFQQAVDAAREWQEIEAQEKAAKEPALEPPPWHGKRGLPPVFLDGDCSEDRNRAALFGIELEPGDEVELTVSEARLIRHNQTREEPPATGQEVAPKPSGAGFPALVAMAGAIAAFNPFPGHEDEGAKPETLPGPLTPEIEALLIEAGLMFPKGCALGKLLDLPGAAIAIPRRLGRDFAEAVRMLAEEGNGPDLQNLLRKRGLID